MLLVTASPFAPGDEVSPERQSDIPEASISLAPRADCQARRPGSCRSSGFDQRLMNASSAGPRLSAELVARAPSMTQRPVLHAAEREPRLASDAAMGERFYGADPVDRLAPRCDGPLPRPRPLRGAGGGPRPRATSTARSRLPASSTARRACLPGCARSLLGRNRQPGCWAPFPRARPGVRARASSSRAFADLPSLSAANAATGPRVAPPGRDFESNRSLNLTRAASLVPRRARFAARSFPRGRGRLTRRTRPGRVSPPGTPRRTRAVATGLHMRHAVWARVRS
jgi:hypothetical protein